MIFLNKIPDKGLSSYRLENECSSQLACLDERQETTTYAKANQALQGTFY